MPHAKAQSRQETSGDVNQRFGNPKSRISSSFCGFAPWREVLDVRDVARNTERFQVGDLPKEPTACPRVSVFLPFTCSVGSETKGGVPHREEAAKGEAETSRSMTVSTSVRSTSDDAGWFRFALERRNSNLQVTAGHTVAKKIFRVNDLRGHALRILSIRFYARLLSAPEN